MGFPDARGTVDEHRRLTTPTPPHQETNPMHSHLAGHLAEARIADIERELARDAHRADIRAARAAMTRPRRRRLAEAVRRIAGTPASSGHTHPARLSRTAAPTPQR
jgi:hypothetical protein